MLGQNYNFLFHSLKWILKFFIPLQKNAGLTWIIISNKTAMRKYVKEKSEDKINIKRYVKRVIFIGNLGNKYVILIWFSGEKLLHKSKPP